MQFSTAACSADGYTQWMFSENHKKIVFVAWAITVVLAAIAVDVTSVTNWAVVACMALIPPWWFAISGRFRNRRCPKASGTLASS